MKKLAVLLQIIGLLAVCPTYVFLEITHTTGANSEVNSGSTFKPKTAVIDTHDSKIPANKTENTISYSDTK